MNPVQGYFSIRLLEKLKEYAEKLEGNSDTKACISESRWGKAWFLALPAGIVLWGLYIYWVINIIPSNPSDIVLFLVFLPFVLLILYLLYLVFSKRMVLVYSWKEFIYYPVIGILYGFALLISYVVAYYVADTHGELVLLITVFLFTIPTIWLLILLIKTIATNRRHPFMGFLLAIFKLVIWIFIWIILSSRQSREKTNEKC